MAGQLWDRRKGESEGAYQAFLTYRDLGQDRTLERVNSTYTGPISKINSLRIWSASHKWVDRARAWDNYLQRERDKETARHAREMERRRLKQIEDAWEDGELLRVKARDMLAIAVYDEEIIALDDGKITVVIKPSRWAMKDLPAFLKTAAELKAAAVAAGTLPVQQMTNAQVDATAEVGSED